jgi:transposase InsO family protein
MNVHSKARTTPFSRELIAHRMEEAAWSSDQAATLGISQRTAYKWLARYRAEGTAGLADRSSRPHVIPAITAGERQGVILELRRRCRMTGPQIARKLRMPRSTVAAVLKRAGVPRLRDLDPPQPVVRYNWPEPGDLLHLDIKKLARIVGVGHRITGDRRDRTRGAGWEYVHVAIDDASRLAYVEVLANEQAETTVGFLKRALIFYRQHHIRVHRVMTDNGSAYVSHVFAELCRNRALRHIRTKPYTPRTNGKAERLIQTLLREWAYIRPYPSSARRTLRLPGWLQHYNHRRPHGSLNGLPPISRV